MKEWEGGNEVLIRLVYILKYQEYCDWILKKDVKDSHMVLCENDGLYLYYEGLKEKLHSNVVQFTINGVTEVDVHSHKVLRVKEIEHAKVLDLSDDGERWEGDVLYGVPYGWGVYYDSENRMVYEGFRLGDVNVCYGTQYYADIQKVEYEGGWCEGRRWGRGVQYDRNGKTVFEGEWINDGPLSKRVTPNEENRLLHNCIEELIVIDESCNGPEWSVLDLSFMSHLRLFQVGDKCFRYVEKVKLIGLSQLEIVVIGNFSFTEQGSFPSYDASRRFQLKNCARLRQLKIGLRSFSDYSVCEIEKNAHLEAIEIGELYGESYNFKYASLKLKSDNQKMK